MSITNFDNFNVSDYQLTSELFSNDTTSVSCMCAGSNIRVTGKSDVGSSELVVRRSNYSMVGGNDLEKSVTFLEKVTEKP